MPVGWSIISTFINPQQANIDSITSDIQTDLIIAKNGSGNVFWPQYNVNAIGNIMVGQGYQFKMNNNTMLSVFGIAVIPENEIIIIPNGWSLLGYLRQNPFSIVSLLNPILSEIIIVKNGEGMVYWPAWNVNAIGNMIPGLGYQIKMNSVQSFTYPSN